MTITIRLHYNDLSFSKHDILLSMIIMSYIHDIQMILRPNISPKCGRNSLSCIEQKSLYIFVERDLFISEKNNKVEACLKSLFSVHKYMVIISIIWVLLYGTSSWRIQTCWKRHFFIHKRRTSYYEKGRHNDLKLTVISP